jgi:hypothetical protein
MDGAPTPADMDDIPGRRLLSASLFGGGVSDELTRDQSELDKELQTLVEQARSHRKMSRGEVVAQVIKVAKKYPGIVNLQSLGHGPEPFVACGGSEQPEGWVVPTSKLPYMSAVKYWYSARFSGDRALPNHAGADISGAEATHPHIRNEVPVLPAKKKLQLKYNRRISNLREFLWKNNTELRKGNKPKVFQGEAYKNTPEPYESKIEQLLEAIDTQMRLHTRSAELQESATKSGISEFWSKWPENKWQPSFVDTYREQLKEQYAAFVQALGGN